MSPDATQDGPLFGTLAEASVRLLRSLETGDPSIPLLETARDLVGAGRAVVLFRDPTERFLEIRAAFGIDHARLHGWEIPVEATPDAIARAFEAIDRSPLASPIRVDGRVVGAIAVWREGAWTDSERHAWAAFTAVADAVSAGAVLLHGVEEARRELETVVDTAPDPILHVDAQGSVVLANAAASALLARADAGPDFVARLEGETEIRVGDEAIYAITSARREDDEAFGTVYVLRDLSADRRREALLRQADKLAAMGTMLAQVAHEVNNALTFVKANVDLLREAPPGEASELADAALRGVERIEELLHGVKVISKPAPSEFRPVDVNEVVRSVAAITAPHFKGKLRLVLDLAPTPRVAGRFQDLGQVVLNLLLNARDAIGEADGVVKVSTREEAGSVELVVADNGPGIPADVQQRLFTPFFTTKEKGTGLGLGICRDIAEAHRGAIVAGNGVDGGARFVVRLPVGPRTIA